MVVGCEVKLIDFNISNTISDKTSITLNNDCGTLNYMAPETLLRDNDSKTRVILCLNFENLLLFLK